MRVLLLLALVSAGCRQVPSWAQTPPGAQRGDPTISGSPVELTRFSTPPTIDGKGDDAVWANADALGPLGDCGDGSARANSAVAGFARLGWDERALYGTVVIRDTKPTSPFARDDVDPHVWGASSGIELILQPGDPGDNRDYYELQIDVNGAVFDSHFDDYNQPITGTTPKDRIFGHQDWSSQVERAIHVEKGRFWSVEFALPWSSLAPTRVSVPPKAGDVWRLNLYTFRDGQRQALAWSPLRGEGNFHRASRFGRVKF